MNVEERLLALEARVRKAEDHLEIVNLLMSYGPLVDSKTSEPAADLWVEGGGYNFTVPTGEPARLEAPEGLVGMYEGEPHWWLVSTGCSHFTATPKVTINGDSATAVGYSFVVLREDDRWFIWRAAINHWTLTRTDKGWRIVERFNRPLNGSTESHDTMRKVLA
ncbi:MAG TPA: nuclear transport factor 2 family protein [Sphingobium sp.]|uniref:nuclear transport factor 2 family protein n=1 Tax=Sphingobium sp. TaxID=1912891 RepID=UPI002ED14046